MTFLATEWLDTVPDPAPEWQDTVPTPREMPALGYRHAPLASRGRQRLARVLWFLALTFALTTTLVLSHLGMDSHLGTYDVATVAHVQAAGLRSLLSAGVTMLLLLLACGLDARLRSPLPVVAAQALAVFFLGIPWSMMATLVEAQLGMASPAGTLGAMGSLVAGVLWLRLLTRCRLPARLAQLRSAAPSSASLA